MKNILKIIFIVFISVAFVVIMHSCKKDKATPPILTTAEPSEITQKTVTSGGNITSDGGEEIIIAGICWSNSANPSVKDKHTNDTRELGSFTSNLIGLTPNTKYYIRAYAYNKAGAGYGNEITFTTSPIALATLTTTDVTSITSSSAISGGNITDDGGGIITSRGVCWATNANPTVTEEHTTDGTGNGAFISNIIGLNPNTIYYVRAYAINDAGVAYGNMATFTTNPIILATLTTNAITLIAETTALSGGKITNDGGGSVTVRGVCWSTEVNPTVYNDKTIDGSGTGSFTSNLTGLQCGMIYYVRAYATNSVGIAYGPQRSFTTKMLPTVFNPNLTYGSVSDIDGNLYKTIQIGTQIWMAENLRTTKYNDGSIILNVTGNTEWHNSVTGAYCWFNNDEITYKTTYGALYNWYAVNTGKLCPTQWHVATNDEWTTLETFLGGNSAGGKMKEAGIVHWLAPNTGATNESGFTGLPGGVRDIDADASFSLLGQRGFWWTSTKTQSGGVYSRDLGHNFIFLSHWLVEGSEEDGFSVRCIKD